MTFPHEWLDHPDKLQSTEFSTSAAFYKKFFSCIFLEAHYKD